MWMFTRSAGALLGAHLVLPLLLRLLFLPTILTRSLVSVATLLTPPWGPPGPGPSWAALTRATAGATLRGLCLPADGPGERPGGPLDVGARGDGGEAEREAGDEPGAPAGAGEDGHLVALAPDAGGALAGAG